MGDLLFQIIFYAQLAREDNTFNFSDITTAITEKLLRRHPHVFPDGTLTSKRSQHADKLKEENIKASWERIKKQERDSSGQAALMADIPAALPATMRALKLQKRAASVGFDWSDLGSIYEKIDEDIAELKKKRMQQNNSKHSMNDVSSSSNAVISEGVGELLFSVIHLARHLNVEPETALRAANNKFEQRFLHMEKRAEEQPTEQ